MSNQKDNSKNTQQNKAIISNTNSAVANYFNVFDHETYVHLAERSSKMVTALYMITDFLNVHDPLRNLIRQSATDAMKELFSLTHAHKHERVETLSRVQNILHALTTYLTVIHRNGFISDMNISVITTELRSLNDVIAGQITKSLPYDRTVDGTTAIQEFSFSDTFFSGSRTEAKHPRTDHIKDTPTSNETIKDNTKTETSLKKTHTYNKNVLDTVRTDNGQKNSVKPSPSKTGKSLEKKAPTKRETEKDNRKDNILKILKQKRNASINDICALFKNCSSKTIQRDLNELIDDGMVKKKGSRRWSTYNLTY
ncbi:DeoR family transcriptional regulator [Patescibacteria group bacterium]|nr:DeoR family transcriptional regulator [Patescibacteria group bacterium]